jgi:lambda repressor-like predicted transcriptional regulator
MSESEAAQDGAMEVKTMTASQINAALRERGLSQWDLAIASGIRQQTLSAVLTGRSAPGPARTAAIEEAIVQLRLDEPAPINPREPVFTVRRAEPEPAESQS